MLFYGLTFMVDILMFLEKYKHMAVEPTKKYVAIDEALPYVGEFGKFQRILGSMFCCIIFPTTYHILIMVFAAKDSGWRCVANSTFCLTNETFSSSNSTRCSIPRSEWTYVESTDFSIVTSYDLSCDKSWLIQMSTSIMFIGWIVGGPLVGWLADNHGRKNVIFVSTAMVLLFGSVTPSMPNIYLFMLLRFIVGFSIAGTNVQMAILLSELVGTEHRPLAGILVWIFFPVALCVLSLKAFLIESWKTLFIVCTVPYLFVILFFKFCPESPRWLRLHGKLDEIMKILDRIARMNNKTIPDDIAILPTDEDTQKIKSNPLHLFNTRNIALISVVMGYGVLTHGVVYYGLSMAASGLGGSLYLNFFLLSLVEIPAAVVAVFLCDRFGRKSPTIVGVGIAGLSCIVLAFLPATLNIARLMFGMLGKLSITVSFNTIYVWAIELYPTSIRSQGMGFLTLSTRIGAGCAPWLVSGLGSLHGSGPYIYMAIVASVCVGLCFFLSETKGLPTLETTEDFGKTREKRTTANDTRPLMI